MKVTPTLYHLPLGPDCPPSSESPAGCGRCDALGCKNPEERDPRMLERALDRAVSGGFEGILVPAGFLDYRHSMALIAECRERQLSLNLRLPAALLKYPVRRSQILALDQDIASLEIIFWNEDEVRLLNRFGADLRQAFRNVRWTYLPCRDLRGRLPSPGLLENLDPWIRQELRFHIPPYDEKDLRSLTTAEAYRFLRTVSKRYPEIRIAPPPGREIWDQRIPEDLGLEPQVSPLFELKASHEEFSPEISVIIPSFDCGPLLKNTIRHLLAQNLDRRRFEILIVDDGSTDGSESVIRNFVAPEAGHLNLRYFYFQRPKKRRMGDGHFRAGIARNLGAKNARGRLLCFLDADILVGPGHLSHLLKQHEHADVIQCVRLHLKDRENNDRIGYSQVDLENDTFVLEGKYWAPFFSTPDWHRLPFFWKYTCTYALSLPKDLFLRIGRFRRTYVYYGFEDTDLGYRLARAGARFLLDPIVTLHQWSARERSEYGNSSLKRHLLLSKTAKVFYLNTLDEEIYRHFESFMRGEWRLRNHCLRWIKHARRPSLQRAISQELRS